MALPALQTVREHFPEAQISVLALPYVADIYRGQGIADELISFNRGGEHAGGGGREKLATELKARKVDTALLLQNAFEGAWIAGGQGIPGGIGEKPSGGGGLVQERNR